MNTKVGTCHEFRSNPLDCTVHRPCTKTVTTAFKMTRKVSFAGNTGGFLSRVQEHSRLSLRKVATGAVVVLAAGMGYHVIFGRNGLTVFEGKRQETQSLTMQMQSLQRENEQLRGHVDRLQSDPSAIEHQAREELHYTRPGEVIYTLPADTPTKTAARK